MSKFSIFKYFSPAAHWKNAPLSHWRPGLVCDLDHHSYCLESMIIVGSSLLTSLTGLVPLWVNEWSSDLWVGNSAPNEINGYKKRQNQDMENSLIHFSVFLEIIIKTSYAMSYNCSKSNNSVIPGFISYVKSW